MPLSTTPNFPGSLDSLPSPSSATFVDDDGFELDLIVQKFGNILELLEAKLGIGATTPDSIYKTLMASAAGTTTWGYNSPVKIGEVVGTGSSGVLEISGIPATFRELLVSLDGGRSTQTSATAAVVRMTFESSPAAGAYNNQRMLAGATAVVADENIGASDFINCGIVPANDSTANVAGSLSIRVPGYAGTSAFKTALVLNCGPAVLSSGNLTALMSAGVFESTAAIARVRLTLSAGNWTTASRMTIWAY